MVKSKQVIFAAKSKVEIHDVEIGDPGPGEVLIRNIFTAISPGTELAFLHHYPNTPGEYPIPFGYSGCGTVLKVGEGVDADLVGKRVVSETNHAAHAVLPVKSCIQVSEEVPPQHMAAYRLASIALQGIRKANIQLGQTVGIIGLGPIGLLVGQLARANGATCVTGIDPVEWRRDLALKHGFDLVTDSSDAIPEGKNIIHDLKKGFDVVVEATGIPGPISTAFQLTRVLGRTILLGSTRGQADDVNFYRDVHKRGITVVGAHESIRGVHDDVGTLWTNRSDEKTIVALAESGRIQFSPLISGTMSAMEAALAYQRITDRKEPLMTLALDWTEVE